MVAIRLNNLGLVYGDTSRILEAEAVLSRALRIRLALYQTIMNSSRSQWIILQVYIRI